MVGAVARAVVGVVEGLVVGVRAVLIVLEMFEVVIEMKF